MIAIPKIVMNLANFDFVVFSKRTKIRKMVNPIVIKCLILVVFSKTNLSSVFLLVNS